MNICSKKILASVLCATLSISQFPISVFATDISGISSNGNVYNIEAAKISGDTGFRQYDKFELSKGDIANLIFNKNYDKFINLVNSQININGILNTMQNGGFYNGHAIFVSPSGMIVGSSGVLNVGSLSVLTPSNDKYNSFLNSYNSGNLEGYRYNADMYKGLITDSRGEVVVNGKILARNNVNIYGKTIQVGNATTQDSGIIAGWQDSSTVFNDQQVAAETFNRLVSNNITNANSFSLKDGKISLKANADQDMSVDDVSTASVNIKNSNIAANDVDIAANTTMDQVYFKEGLSKVDVEDSKISGDNININATTSSQTSKNVNFIPPVVWAWLFEDDANIGEYFSSNMYQGFAGTRSTANVNIKNSIINATNNIDILSNAGAKFEANSDWVGEGSIPYLFYAFGTKTNSNVNIDNSELNAVNDINLKALSNNNLNVIMDDDILFVLNGKVTDAYHPTFLKTSTIADTSVNILNNSKIESKNFSAKSIALNTVVNSVSNTATVGKNDFGSETDGGSGAAFVYHMNNEATSSNVSIKNSKISTSENSDVEAVNLNSSKNVISITTASKGYEKREDVQNAEGEGGLWHSIKKTLGDVKNWGVGKYNAYKSKTTADYTALFKNMFGQAQNNVGNEVQQNANVELNKANFKAGGGVLVNNTSGRANVNIENSEIKAKNLSLDAYTLDSYSNRATASSASSSDDKESAFVGAGISVIVNNKLHDTNVNIKNSTLNVDNLNISAVNELPGTEGMLGITNKFFKLGLGINQSANDDWDFSWKADTEGMSIAYMPSVGLFGFFNNFAAAATTGDKLAISASVVCNSIVNNVNSVIENSIINATNRVNVDTVNSIAARDAAGFLGAESILTVTNLANLYKANGLGGSILVQNVENNAKSNIDNSTITIKNGDLNLAAASEQSYLNVATIGGKSNQVSINGAVNVQNITGETSAKIKNSSKVSANNVNLNAGKANVKFSKNGATLNNGEFERSDARDVNDHVSNIALVGVLTNQKKDKADAASADVAFGSAVNVQSVDRTIKSAIENSEITANNNLNVLSNSNTNSVALALGAALADGYYVGNGAAQGANIGVGNANNIVNDAVNNADNGNIIGDLDNVDGVDGANGINAVNQAANAVQNQITIAGAGSVNVLTNNVKTESNISSSIVNVSNDLNVTSNQDKLTITGAGAVAKSGTVGVGAGIDIYTDKGSTKSIIGNTSTINFNQSETASHLNLGANDTNSIYDIAVGVGIASESVEDRPGLGVGGSFVLNTIRPTISAEINNSVINGNSNKTDVNLDSLGKVKIVDVAGTAAIVSSDGIGVGASIASSANSIKSSISSLITNSVLNKVNNLTLNSKADNDLFSIGVSTGLVGTNTNTGFAFDGAVGVDYFNNNVNSKILGSTIEASGDINVKSESNTANTNLAGTLEVSAASSGLGANGDVIFNIHNSTITSLIDENSTIGKANNLKLLSQSNEKSIISPVGAAIATGNSSMLAANVNYNCFENNVNSILSGNIITDNNINVLAYDDSTIYARGGTLALSSAEGLTAIGGTVNIDNFDKNVSAKIENATINKAKDVVVNAQSINSIGGSKKEDGTYDIPNITGENYKNILLNSNGDAYSEGSSFNNWNMFYNVAAGAKLAADGTVVFKTIQNEISAEVNNSQITAASLTVQAEDYSIKNIIVGMLDGSSTADIGASILVTSDKSHINSIISSGSDLKITNAINVNAKNRKDNHFVTAILGFGGNFGLGANVIKNDSDDHTVAKVEGTNSNNVKIDSNELSVKAEENINATRVGLVAKGSKNVAIQVQPMINNYSNEVTSNINYADIKNSQIGIYAYDDINTTDILAGVTGAGQGFSAGGLAIKNYYDDTINSSITNSIIETSNNINLDAYSKVDSSNWILSGGFVGQGANIIANIILNTLQSNVRAGISNSDIKKAGDITIYTNKEKQDVLKNVAGSISFAAEGAALETNTIYNLYKNSVTSYFDDTVAKDVSSLNISAYSNRDITNTTVGISGAAIGASILFDALVNEIDTNLNSYVDAKSKKIDIIGDLTVNANDYTTMNNTMGFVDIAGLGAAIGANINIINANNIVKSEILSATSGSISANNVAMHSNNVFALDNTNITVSLGAGSLAGDIVVINLGQRSDSYTKAEEKANIKEAVKQTKDRYDENTKNDTKKGLYNPTSSSSDIKTGSISRINGNVTGKNNISSEAYSQLKGTESDTLSLKNVKVGAGLADASVGVKSVKLNSNTIAEISGGTVTSNNGNVSVNAESKNDVSLVNTSVDVAGVTVGGAFGTYINNSNTIASIADATVKAGDINVLAKSSNKAEVDGMSVLVNGINLGMSVSNATDNNNTIAIVSGATNLDALGDVNIHATGSSDLSAVLRTVKVSVFDIISYLENNSTVSAVTKAIIEDVTGTIKSNNLNIIADLDKMSTMARSNIVSVSGVDIANVGSSGAFLTSTTTAGIKNSNDTNLTINNVGNTNIKSGVKASNNDEGAELSAISKILLVDVSLIAGVSTDASATAENNATVSVYLTPTQLSTNNLNISAFSNAVSNAVIDSTKYSTVFGSNAGSLVSKLRNNLNVTIAGENSIKEFANISAINNSNNNATLDAINTAVIAAVNSVNLETETSSNTNISLGGKYNASSTALNSQTTRNSKLDLTARSGAFVNVSNANAKNTVSGSSVLTIDGLINNADKSNALSIKHLSENTLDMVTTNTSGGFVSVSNTNPTSIFDTSTILNIKNSTITSDKDLAVNVHNTNIIKDSASQSNGGFVATVSNETANTYNSTATLNIENSIIKAKNISLSADTTTRTANDDYIQYVGSGGGFVASNRYKVTNNINQNNNINIKNSRVIANNNLKINALTTTFFKQKTSTSASGFVAIPKNWNYLNVTNSNNISLDKDSLIRGDDKTEINFDSNDTLAAYSRAEAHHFGFKDPETYSAINLAIRNRLDNNGSIQAGNDVEIASMKNSTYNLDQYAYSEAHAAIATTTEDGILSRTIDAVMNINSGADITSGKNVTIRFLNGIGTSNSEIAYKTVSYVAMGIPITKTGSTSKKSFSYNDALRLDGDIIAGKGNSKYMKINRDGSIDISTSGFYSDEYTLINEQKLSPEELKDKEKIDLDIDLKEVTTELTLLDGNLSEINAKLQDIETQITENTSVLTKFEKYDFKSENNLSSEVLTSFKELLLGSDDNITEDQYSKILTSYKNECAEIEARNQEKYAKGVQEGYEDVPSIDEYLENKYAEFGLSQAQLKTINDACDIEGALFNIVEIGGLDYCLYNGKDGKEYIIVGEDSNPKKVISDKLETLQKIRDEYKDIQTNYKSKIAILNEKKKDIESDILALDNKSYNVDNYLYAILFNGIKNQSSYVDIYINKNSDIQGSGNIRVASPGVKIDNYSNRNLLFLDVDLDATYKNGLNINDYNYNVFQDKAVAINNDKAEAYIMEQEGTFDGLPTSGVHYLSHEATNGKTDVPTGFTINNYYDNSNPFAPSKEASSIFFLSSVYSNSGLNIWNESGDVIFCDLLNTTNAKILSTQGALSFLSINEDVNFKLNGDNNYFYAGKGIGIKAKNIDISNIKMVAGTSSRTVTITEDMLNNLIEDPTTGEINMINLGGEISPYLNAVNNIKAVYKDGQIYLFDIAQTDGTIKLETSGNLNLSNVSDMYKTSEGYQTITINNQTSTPINIREISNLKFDGGIFHNGTRITDIGTNTKQDSANTRIDSNGLLTINKPILNNLVYNGIERTYSSENKNGELLINSKNGLKLNTTSEIRNSGKVSIKNSDKEMQIQGAIYNTGDITIDKYGSGDSIISAIINNTDGNINMYNSGTGDYTITSESVISLNKNTNPLLEGNINITNRSNTTGNLIILSDLINSGKGDVNILVEEGSTSSLNINKNVTANIGDIFILNEGTRGIKIADSKISTIQGNVAITRDGQDDGISINSNSEILAENGNIQINNKGGKGTEVNGNVTANSGDITVTNTQGATNISGTVIAEKGQISLTNRGKDGVNISGKVINNEGDTNVSNSGNGLIEIIGSIFNKKGTQIVSNTNTDSTSGIVVATSGTLTNENGNIQINNEGGKGTEVNGNVTANSGDITVTNTQGATNILGTVIAEKGQISLTNRGKDGVNISGKVINNEGDTNVSNSGNGLIEIIGSIFNKKGTQIVSNTNTDSTSGIVVATSGTLTNENGNIQINNEGGKGTEVNGNVTANSGDITVVNTQGATNISGTVIAEKGQISLTNRGKDGVNISGKVINNEGDTNVSNSGNGLIEIIGSIFNKKGTQIVSNTNTDSTSGIVVATSGTLTNENGNIQITNKGGKGTEVNGNVTANSGDITVANTQGATNISGTVIAEKGQISLTNRGKDGVNISGKVINNEGDTNVSNSGNGLIEIIGSIFNKKGTQIVSNTNTDSTSGIVVATSGTLTNENGNIQITNKGGKGTEVNGNVNSNTKDIIITNSASNIVIGEYSSDNDNYLQANNVIINQTNGNILNGILDEIGVNHTNYDLGNPNKSYKTLILTTGNLELNVVDGNIGESDLDNPAFSIDARTRDYTDSINVNVGGTLSAKALNQNSNEKRLVNIRAKDSDLNVKNVISDGDIILTAGDWHQADMKPAPNNDEYYIGYSILNAAGNNNSAISGQNVSLIASNNVGTTDNPLSYTQDTLNAPNSSISVEAESDINLTVKANSDNPAKLYQLISKRGNSNLSLNSDTEIASITSGKNLHIVSTGKNLTIYEIGTSDLIGSKFNDILYPHDNIDASNSKSGSIPESIDIEVLDSYGGNNANSTLKIYSAMVKGRNNGQGAYYEDDGSRKADVFLMADNIYANSYLAPDSVTSAREYSDVVFGGNGSNIIKAKGINAVGSGVELALDVRGVNKDIVNIVSPDATRTNYKTQEQVQSPVSKFLNDYAIITDNYVDYRANDVVISINDIVGQNRNARLNTLISDEAYINTLSDKLSIYEGYINDYAEFRNNSKFVIIDNINRRLYDNVSAQLYTEKTGSFNLFMDKTINIRTSAGTVWNNPHLLVNNYHSAWTFVNRAQKESKNQYDRLDMKNNKMQEEQVNIKALVTGIDVPADSKISDMEIINISYKGATLKTKGKMLLSKIYYITFYLEDNEKYTLKVNVISSDEGLTRVEFIDAPEDIVNKIMYRSMLKANL